MTVRSTIHRNVKRFRKAKRLVQTARLQNSKAAAHRRPIKPNTVLYETYSGNGMTCHPEAIFQQLLREPDMQHLEHIWVLNDFERFPAVLRRYAGRRNVRFVKYQSLAYYRALSTSKYLINNVTFPNQFSKREGQVYIGTWHGVPLKKMGYHVEGHAADAKNIVRNFLAADYLLSAGPKMTELMYLDAFKMANIYEGAILEIGNPRVDRQSDPVNSRNELDEWMAAAGLAVDDRDIILYAPTWKGASYFNPANDAANLQATIEELERRIDTSRHRVLLKAHQVVAEAVSRNTTLGDRLIPNEVPTNVVLGASSMLITDYSSIFYDFVASGRPVFFYTPDFESYRSYRDVYVEPEEFPGPVSRDVEELARHITETVARANRPSHAVAERYEQCRRDYAALDDGGASARLVDIVFRGNESGHRVRRGFSDGREKILMYVGSLPSNGITSSALNLLDNINYDRFDVTVFYAYSNNEDNRRNARRINKNARALPRVGTFNGAFRSNRRRAEELKTGWGEAGDHRPEIRALWRDEWNRCFGNAQFDYIVDFSGYSPFWGYLFLQGKAKKRSIWMHNDLAADAERTVDGKQPLRDGLMAVFQMYHRFDNLVSVSPSLKEINSRNLADWAHQEKFSHCLNSVNAEWIGRLAFGNQMEPETENRLIEGALHPLGSIGSGHVGSASMPSNLVEAVHELARLYPLPAIREEVGRQLHRERLMPDAPGVKTFISVGRLSPEKNHARLIRAFAEVHAAYPHTRLVILGDGPLRPDLHSLIVELNLSNAVKLLGAQKNPFLFMAKADCFVMSSDYEGQPMVILEALVLGLPIVSTSFGSIRDALPDGNGLVVERSEEALAAGMAHFLDGDIPRPPFDVSEHNRKAMAQFYESIGVDPEAALEAAESARLPVDVPELVLED